MNPTKRKNNPRQEEKLEKMGFVSEKEEHKNLFLDSSDKNYVLDLGRVIEWHQKNGKHDAVARIHRFKQIVEKEARLNDEEFNGYILSGEYDNHPLKLNLYTLYRKGEIFSQRQQEANYHLFLNFCETIGLQEKVQALKIKAVFEPKNLQKESTELYNAFSSEKSKARKAVETDFEKLFEELGIKF